VVCSIHVFQPAKYNCLEINESSIYHFKKHRDFSFFKFSFSRSGVNIKSVSFSVHRTALNVVGFYVVILRLSALRVWNSGHCMCITLQTLCIPECNCSITVGVRSYESGYSSEICTQISTVSSKGKEWEHSSLTWHTVAFWWIKSYRL
jgi:hypothetical protein